MGTATEEADRRQADSVASLIVTADRALRNAIAAAQNHPFGDHTVTLLRISHNALEAAGDFCQEDMVRN